MPLTFRPPLPRRAISLTVVAGVVAALGWAATRAEGFVTPEPELHDAGVWVTRTDERRVGRTNTEIRTVDTSLSMVSSSFDVLQADATVYVRQHDPSQLLAVDPVRASVVPGPELPHGVEFELRGGTAAALDPATGALVVTGELDLLGDDVAAVEVGSFGSLPVLQRSGEQADRLAVMTDKALLSVGFQDGDVEAVVDGGAGMIAALWREVDLALAEVRGRFGRWERLRAAVSLASLRKARR